MEALADLVARHALLILFGASAILLVATATFWNLVVAYAPAAWKLAMDAWNWLNGTRFASRARQLRLLRPWLTGTLTVARFLGAFAIAATICGALMNRLLKAIFERDRPLHDHGLVSETGWSFPSGHASGSMLVYGLLGYLVVRNTPRAWHVPVALASVALVVFVGSSRVFLQVHYLSDVLAGYASGAAWVALCIARLETARARQPAL